MEWTGIQFTIWSFTCEETRTVCRFQGPGSGSGRKMKIYRKNPDWESIHSNFRDAWGKAMPLVHHRRIRKCSQPRLSFFLGEVCSGWVSGCGQLGLLLRRKWNVQSDEAICLAWTLQCVTGLYALSLVRIPIFLPSGWAAVTIDRLCSIVGSFMDLFSAT